MGPWFEGVYLVGKFNWFQTGVWLLIHNNEAAILELPPSSITGFGFGSDPVLHATSAVRELGVTVKFLLCTHGHRDHFHPRTLQGLQKQFPDSTTVLQSEFRGKIGEKCAVRYFPDLEKLSLAGEPLFLIHAPKHSLSDTMVIFRGIACTGDWELGTVRTVNEEVPIEIRRQSCDRMLEFTRSGYHIHRTFSVHANDRRENVDFEALLAATREDHKLW